MSSKTSTSVHYQLIITLFSQLSPTSVFTGLTFVLDFSAHAHKDKRNLPGSATVLVVLHDPERDKEDYVEQWHYLPAFEVAVAGGHGSILVEEAQLETHSSSTTRSAPNYKRPSRLGVVFYCHNFLAAPQHGKEERRRAAA